MQNFSKEKNDDQLSSRASGALAPAAAAASDRFHLAKGHRRRLMRKSKSRHPHALPMHDCDRNILPARRPVCNFSQIRTALLPLRSPLVGYFKEGRKTKASQRLWPEDTKHLTARSLRRAKLAFWRHVSLLKIFSFLHPLPPPLPPPP